MPALLPPYLCPPVETTRPRWASIPRSSRACTGASALARLLATGIVHRRRNLGFRGAGSVCAVRREVLIRFHEHKNPPNASSNVYQTADNRWFLIVMQPKDWPAIPPAIGRPELPGSILALRMTPLRPGNLDNSRRSRIRSSRRATAGALARHFRARAHHLRESS